LPKENALSLRKSCPRRCPQGAHAGGEPVAVEPQVFDLLLHLIRDRVLSKDDLIDGVWGGRASQTRP
jgi:DNA-binding response OmpR family regulator